MSRGPEGPGDPNQNDTIGLGPITGPCSWAPEGVATRMLSLTFSFSGDLYCLFLYDNYK